MTGSDTPFTANIRSRPGVALRLGNPGDPVITVRVQVPEVWDVIRVETPLPPAAVLEAAKSFFVRRNSIYAAFPEGESPTHVNLRGMGGEEIVIGVAPIDGGTRVTASSYLFDQQIARFFSTLPLLPASSTGDARQGAA